MSGITEDVAIIGAGLGGCALALALSAKHINLEVYESRPPEFDVLASGVVLTPNGLAILDRLGVLSRIQDRCYKSTYRTFKNDKDETARKTLVADPEKYGYCNHRIWRKLLLDEMKLMLEERNIPIKYDAKFTGIISDTANDVAFSINEAEHHASILIGSDGIYSTVRKHLNSTIQPEYTGTVGILAHIKRASINWPYEDYERNATIQGEPGAFFFIPENPEAEDIMIGMQVQYPQQSRDDLERLQADKDQLVGMYRKGYDDWGPTAQSIIDLVTENKETCYIWPYMRMPKLKRWFSETGRVILVGDGAHALPPSSGQSINQALEDVCSLSMLLAARSSDDRDQLVKRLALWQSMRQDRIDAILRLGHQRHERPKAA